MGTGGVHEAGGSAWNAVKSFASEAGKSIAALPGKAFNSELAASVAKVVAAPFKALGQLLFAQFSPSNIHAQREVQQPEGHIPTPHSTPPPSPPPSPLTTHTPTVANRPASQPPPTDLPETLKNDDKEFAQAISKELKRMSDNPVSTPDLDEHAEKRARMGEKNYLEAMKTVLNNEVLDGPRIKKDDISYFRTYIYVAALSPEERVDILNSLDPAHKTQVLIDTAKAEEHFKKDPNYHL